MKDKGVMGETVFGKEGAHRVVLTVLSSFSHAQTIGNGVISFMYDACIT